VSVEASFVGGQVLGLFITLAIAVHNIPEGLTIGLVLVFRRVGWFRAALGDRTRLPACGIAFGVGPCT
jgi:ZIP family zinc transporter